ncbi:MAG: D-serine ammonia-lyase [Clostridia bacterium]
MAERSDLMENILAKKNVFHRNDKKTKNLKDCLGSMQPDAGQMLDAKNRLHSFMPLVGSLFPETGDGTIESPLVRGSAFSARVYGDMEGELLIKLDSHLPVAGSIKARGGIYEVLRHMETLLMGQGLMPGPHVHGRMLSPEARAFLSGRTLSVASTGNLGLSIGLAGKALGFDCVVHMSREAKQWKRKRLLDRGVRVVEHAGDFNEAANEARKEAEQSETIHFVDDEHSMDLFLGYAVAAYRLKDQLEEQGICPDLQKPLHVYLPCGVGGAPGGITFGLKHVFGEAVETYIAEPVACPSMLLSSLTGKYGETSVYDYGLDNKTSLDGLAVARCSPLAGPIIGKLCSGFYTVQDEDMYMHLYTLNEREGIRIEPSAAAGFDGPIMTGGLHKPGWHVVWTTGGLFIPDDIYGMMYVRGMEDARKNRD